MSKEDRCMKISTSTRLLQRTRRALLVLTMLCLPVAAIAQVAVSVAIAPPPLPVYEQPFAPGPGYIWTPGYWAWGPEGYYWVPGTWVLAPYVGALWTPGYWGWNNGAYLWRAGYWGPRVGYYGGVNYGYGYTGSGYHGGYWRGGSFYYNSAVNHVNPGVVHNTYHANVNNVTVNRSSYYGGTGGTTMRPNPAERNYMNQPHTAVTPGQIQHQQAAASNRQNFASVNQGRPAVPATQYPQGHPQGGQGGQGGHPQGQPQGGPHGGGGGGGGGGGHRGN
jgi:uncharacterized membrane protein YgcG